MARSPRRTPASRARMTLKMASRNLWLARRLLFLAALSLPLCSAQTNVLTVIAPDKVTAKHGALLDVKTQVQLKPGYHANSNTPSEAYLIPMRLTWAPGPLE